MITTDFAPNERFADAAVSFATLLFPWTWKEGGYRKKATGKIGENFPGADTTLFLSGRGSMTAILKSLELSAGSEIVVAGYTCEAVVLPMIHLGFKPIYADIEDETFSLEPASVEKQITGRTRAVVLQHTYGLIPKHRDRVLQLARQKNMFVIEDLAHGFEPSFWQKQHLGAKQLLLLSFGRSKALSSVFGGAAVTADPQLATRIHLAEEKMQYPSMVLIARLLCYKPIAWAAKQTYNFFSIGKAIHYLGKFIGLLVAEISHKEKQGRYDEYLEKKYPNALAKLLLHQLKGYADTMGERKRATDVYRKYFKLSSQSVPTRFPVQVEERDKILNDVAREGVHLGSWYTQPVAPRELNLATVMYRMGSCPVAERVCGRIINLPTLVNVDQAEKLSRLIQI